MSFAQPAVPIPGSGKSGPGEAVRPPLLRKWYGLLHPTAHSAVSAGRHAQGRGAHVKEHLLLWFRVGVYVTDSRGEVRAE